MPTIFKSSIAALALSLSFASAQAAPVTHNTSAIINSAAFFESSLSLFSGFDARARVYPDISYSGFPFSFSDGDTIEMDVLFANGGLTLTDAGFSQNETLFIPSMPFVTSFDGLTDNPNNDFVISYDIASTVTITDFTGDLLNANLDISTQAFGFSPSLTFTTRGDFTDSSVTLNRMSISATFTNITYLPGFEQYSSFTTITAPERFAVTTDNHTPTASVPLPGALALIGVGLFGVFSLRRKQTTQKDGDAP